MKVDLTENNKEDDSMEIMDVARRCVEVINVWGKDGHITEKGMDEDGLKILSDFAWAMGAKLTAHFVPMKKDIEESPIDPDEQDDDGDTE